MVSQDFREKVFRFVVLEHVRQGDVHWDLMLQLPDRELLATWQIRMNPAQWAGCHAPIPALQLPDHRFMYLDYEGEISGGRGAVSRVDLGDFKLRRLEEEQINLFLRGQKLHGIFTLRRWLGDANESHWWELQYEHT